VSVFDDVQIAIAAIKEKYSGIPQIGVVLGSGLGAFADCVENATVIPYNEIPSFPSSGVVGHAGQLLLGTVAGVEVAVMSGRVHYYEGHSMEKVTFPIRVLAGLGIKQLFITNAAGAVNESFKPGDFMVITDHINLTGDNPLRGPNDERLGARFPDMSTAYQSALQEVWKNAASQVGCKLQSGVYVGLSGPSYETPAEIRMLRTLGVDAVGMSTVAEVIVAAHSGIEVAGLSVITNYAAGILEQPLSHEEVTATGREARPALCALLEKAIGELK